MSLFMLGEVELAGRSLAYLDIELNDLDDTWVQVYDAFSMLQMLYLPKPKKLEPPEATTSSISIATQTVLSKGLRNRSAVRPRSNSEPNLHGKAILEGAPEAPVHSRISTQTFSSTLDVISPSSARQGLFNTHADKLVTRHTAASLRSLPAPTVSTSTKISEEAGDEFLQFISSYKVEKNVGRGLLAIKDKFKTVRRTGRQRSGLITNS